MTMKLHIPRLAFPALLLASGPAAAQNLISDPSLELGVVNVCDQGQVPDTWFNTSGTADTYTYDCSVLPGLAADGYAHFINLPAAHDGMRFIAGWSAANETFGTSLSQPLVAGNWYDVRAWFAASETIGGTGSYAIWLSMGPTMSGAVQVANIGASTTVGVWTEDVAHFQAPGAFTHMILQPDGPAHYVASDSWSIEAVGGPQPFCEAAANSVGGGAHMGFSGSVVIANNQFELLASDLPPGVWGQFCYGTAQMQVPFGDGFRCVGAERRLPPLARADSAGVARHQVDLTVGPISTDAMPGGELYFQYWYRDGAAGGAGFNLTDGLIVRFQ